MGIETIYAEHAETIKKKWVHELKSAINDESKSDSDKLRAIAAVVDTIGKHYFLK